MWRAGRGGHDVPNVHTAHLLLTCIWRVVHKKCGGGTKTEIAFVEAIVIAFR
jgi:hypothetical protein